MIVIDYNVNFIDFTAWKHSYVILMLQTSVVLQVIILFQTNNNDFKRL